MRQGFAAARRNTKYCSDACKQPPIDAAKIPCEVARELGIEHRDARRGVKVSNHHSEAELRHCGEERFACDTDCSAARCSFISCSCVGCGEHGDAA